MLSATQAYDAQHTAHEKLRGTRRSAYNSAVYHQSTENNIVKVIA